MPEPEPDTALPKEDRFFKGCAQPYGSGTNALSAMQPRMPCPVCRRYTTKPDESGCTLKFALTFAAGDGQDSVVAARGTRKHAKGRWKYESEPDFVSAQNKAWSDLSLKPFSDATARVGVLRWLKWLMQHTPIPSTHGTARPEDDDAEQQ